ncbi:MAG: hypothetical protein E5V52_04450 [Mesorhizobium sp.]|uniref:hypothetical protein n=1 Tax=Mesorhizobium sp. M2A.F.Ca.ET.067.02.1.1 TaxID=2496749 RepID=UPI000FD5EB12|nr:hypothetical protein [Mesorhizobium sp. M2A.F.Ca.ET.067.02.1.1]RUW81516.1 hypothetical protein EOA28_00905 [Mesorhizobium sp. M2A.F.Ca.ET.067.02.1.1]TIU53409.1 MAG: hypothetical protein E5W35_26605 [Mesorhizobium sp.]TIW87293.1 MAG: hypothetical protein E5V52_04450 [Mesorhizobium sp.]
MFFIDCWSVGLDEIPRKLITPERILTILQREGRFSNFEATANQVIARAITSIVDSNLVETYRPGEPQGERRLSLGLMSVSPRQACASSAPARRALITTRLKHS